MTSDVFRLVLLVLALAAFGLYVWHMTRADGVSSRLKPRVLVTLKSGATFDGVLFAADRATWVLRNAQALGAGDNGSTVPVDGEVLIFVADVEYVQKP